ncbi:MAG: hypothetical protein M5R36_04855 [Deltaproteobacteria bacterium]|nr:hypothetical protein [Deltaproteobacteria bacterium]
MYRLARKGLEIERKPVAVELHELRLIERRRDAFRVFVRCSKGTYVRSLADELGRRLGGAAHLSSLRRLSSGNWSVDRARRLDDLIAHEAEATRSAQNFWRRC